MSPKKTKTHSKLHALLATTACSLLTVSCAKDLPELPEYAYPAIQTQPELPPISAVTNPQSLHERPASSKAATTLPTPPGLPVPPGARYEVVDLSFIPSAPSNAHGNSPLKVIANDLVTALSLVTGMSRDLITVKAPANRSQFDELVTTAFAKKGYTVNNTRALNAGKQLTTSFLIKSDNSIDKEIIGIISINGVLIKRSYVVTENTLEANTSYQIKGVTLQQVSDTSLFQII